MVPSSLSTASRDPYVRWGVAVALVMGHVAISQLILTQDTVLLREATPIASAETWLINEAPPPSKVAEWTPPVVPRTLRHPLDIPSPIVVVADAPEAVIAPRSAPQVDTTAWVDMAPYAQRAGLRAGEGATVVLRVLVNSDGYATNVEIDVSSGSSTIDATAVEYALALRWLPGTESGAPAPTWVRWPIRVQA